MASGLRLSRRVGSVACVVLCPAAYAGEPGAVGPGLPAGVTVSGEYVAEYSKVVAGGVRTAGSFRHLFTADLTLDMDTIAGIEGGTVFMQFLSVNAERGGSSDAGDIQVYSNIENDRSLSVLYELWYEQLWLSDRLRVKVGKVDANTEFNFVVAAGDFTNSSAGFSPTIFVFPSYPDPAMSVNVFLDIYDAQGRTVTLGYGFYDGAAGVDGVPTGSRGPSTFFESEHSDDHFHIGEAALAWGGWGGWHDGRLAVGGWWHTGEFETFAGEAAGGTGGAYLVVEQRIYAPQGGDDPAGLYLFGQYGWADETVSEVGQHVAGGVVARGLCAARPGDSAGLYVSHADLSDEPGAGFDGNETVLEAYYRVGLTEDSYIQPLVQWVVNPSGGGQVDDAVVAGVRAGTAF